MPVEKELESLPVLIETILRCFSRQAPTRYHAFFMEAALDRFIREEVRSLAPSTLMDKFATPKKTIDHFLSYLENIHATPGHRTSRMLTT